MGETLRADFKSDIARELESNFAREPRAVTRITPRHPGLPKVCMLAARVLSLMAHQVMHIARRTMARATGTRWSLRCLRERVLRVNGGVKLGHGAAQNWTTLSLGVRCAVSGGQSAALSM